MLAFDGMSESGIEDCVPLRILGADPCELGRNTSRIPTSDGFVELEMWWLAKAE